MKILIGLIGIVILGFFAIDGYEYYKWEQRCHLGKERSHDVLERGEKEVIEYLEGAGWAILGVYQNDILSIEGEYGILEAEASVLAKKRGKNAMLLMRYGFDSDCEVYGMTVLRKLSEE